MQAAVAAEREKAVACVLVRRKQWKRRRRKQRLVVSGADDDLALESDPEPEDWLVWLQVVGSLHPNGDELRPELAASNSRWNCCRQAN